LFSLKLSLVDNWKSKVTCEIFFSDGSRRLPNQLVKLKVLKLLALCFQSALKNKSLELLAEDDGVVSFMEAAVVVVSLLLDVILTGVDLGLVVRRLESVIVVFTY